MAIKDALLAEFDHEMQTTRRLLERVPEEALGWKPHEKSMSLAQLAAHVANLASWAQTIMAADSFDLASFGTDVRPKMPSREWLLNDFDTKTAGTRKRFAEATDPEFLARWTLKKDGQEMFSLPRISAIRSFVMNHIIHHRGKLSVYLRLQNVPVPPIYGPTADEG